jgi:Flp pilus assembly protein TadG
MLILDRKMPSLTRGTRPVSRMLCHDEPAGIAPGMLSDAAFGMKCVDNVAAHGREMMLKTFARSEHGGVFVYMAVAVPFIAGMLGLAIDASNLYSLDSELQHAADAAALSAAKELDGAADASTRAVTAAQTTVQNYTIMSFGQNKLISIPTVQFYDYNCNVAGTALTGTPAQIGRFAACVKVTTEAKPFTYQLLRMVRYSGVITDTATAVAKTTYTTCQSSPLMVCESGTVNLNGATPGKQYRLTTPASNSGALFGRLLPPAGSSVPSSSNGQQASTYLGYAGGGGCFANIITPDTGNANGTTARGINTRFDLYPNGNANPNLATFPPAPQSVGGLSECTGNSVLSTGSYPRDTSFNGWEGNGTKSWTTYLSNFHNSGDAANVAVTANSNLTRYAMYLTELGLDPAAPDENATFTTAQINTLRSTGKFPKNAGNGGNTENAAPACYSGGATSFAMNRRIIYVAVSNNCGNSISTGLVVSRYAKFFITEASANDDIWAEFIGWVDVNGTNGTFRRRVELVQ